MAEPSDVQSDGEAPCNPDLRALLQAYDTLLQGLGDSRPITPRAWLRPRWLVRHFVLTHVTKVTQALNAVYLRRAAIADEVSSSEAPDRSALEHFQKSLPKANTKLLASITIAATFVVGRVAVDWMAWLYAGLARLFTLAMFYLRFGDSVEATGGGRSAVGRSAGKLYEQFPGLLSFDPTKVFQTLKGLFAADYRDVGVLVLSLCLAVYAVLRVAVPSFRMKRLLFNNYPDGLNASGSLAAQGWNMRRTVGVYARERDLFDRLGSVPPGESPFDVLVLGLFTAIPFGLGVTALASGLAVQSDGGYTRANLGLFLIAVGVARLASLIWLWRTRQRGGGARVEEFEIEVEGTKGLRLRSPVTTGVLVFAAFWSTYFLQGLLFLLVGHRLFVWNKELTTVSKASTGADAAKYMRALAWFSLLAGVAQPVLLFYGIFATPTRPLRMLVLLWFAAAVTATAQRVKTAERAKGTQTLSPRWRAVLSLSVLLLGAEYLLAEYVDSSSHHILARAYRADTVLLLAGAGFGLGFARIQLAVNRVLASVGAPVATFAVESRELGAAADEAEHGRRLGGRRMMLWSAAAALGFFVIAGIQYLLVSEFDIEGYDNEVAIASDAGTLWVASELSESITHIDPTNAQVIGRVKIGIGLKEVTAAEGGIWILNRKDGTLSRVSSTTHDVRTVALSEGQHSVSWLRTGIATGFESVWVGGMGAKGELYRVNGATLQVTRIPLPSRPQAIAQGFGSIWVAGRTGSVFRVDPHSNRVTAEIEIEEPLRFIAAGEGFVWVTSWDDSVVRIDPGRNVVVPGKKTRVSGADRLVVGGGAAWVESRYSRRVTRLDAASGREDRGISLWWGPKPLILVANDLWVARAGGQKIARVDTRSRRVGPTVRVRSPAVWLPAPADRQVIGVDADREAVVKRLDVQGVPRSVARNGPQVWVASSQPGMLHVLDAETGEDDPAQAAVGDMSSAVSAAGSIWAAVESEEAVVRIEPHTKRALLKIRVGGRPHALASGLNGVWVAVVDDSGGAVELIDPRTNAVVRTVPVGGRAMAIAIGSGAVWATDEDEGLLHRVHPENGSVASVPVDMRPSAIAVGAGSVWILDRSRGIVIRLNPTTNQVVATVPLEGTPATLLYEAGAVWVGAAEGGVVTRIDPADNRGRRMPVESSTSSSTD